jgi:hypothetical protein
VAQVWGSWFGQVLHFSRNHSSPDKS